MSRNRLIEPCHGSPGPGSIKPSGGVPLFMTAAAPWFAVLVTPAGALAGCGRVTGAVSAASPRKPTVVALVPLTPRLRRVCLDPVTSFTSAFVRGVVSTLAAALSSCALPSRRELPTVGVLARAGLDLWLRQVTTYALSVDQPALECPIPSVQELPAPPKLTDPNLITDQLNRDDFKKLWSGGSVGSQSGRQIGGGAVEVPETRPVGRPECGYAVSNSPDRQRSTGPHVKMRVASDLRNNRAAMAAMFHGSPELAPSDRNAASELVRWVRVLELAGPS